MPTYVYKCAQCGHMFEARQRMSEDPLTDCPSCEANALRRVINSVGIVFKGSGFYVTDNRNGKNGAVSGNGSSAGADSKEPDTQSETGAASTESKSPTEKASKTEKSAPVSDK